jgi:GNAT superfamily N-acetyltransferase
MTDLAALAVALSVPDYVAHAERDGERIEVAWSGPVEHPVLVDRRTPGSAAEATLLLLDDGAEWTRLIVEPSAMGSGIFSACMGLSEDFLRGQGLWPALVAAAANNATFYRTAGFHDDPERPGYLVKDQNAAQRWLAR